MASICISPPHLLMKIKLIPLLLLDHQVRLAANSLVTKDIQEPGDYGGFPAVSIYQRPYHFNFARLFILNSNSWLCML